MTDSKYKTQIEWSQRVQELEDKIEFLSRVGLVQGHRIKRERERVEELEDALDKARKYVMPGESDSFEAVWVRHKELEAKLKQAEEA